MKVSMSYKFFLDLSYWLAKIHSRIRYHTFCDRIEDEVKVRDEMRRKEILILPNSFQLQVRFK